jgi:hypothetical protein
MDPFHSTTQELRGVATSVDQARDHLERLEHQLLRQSADMGTTLSRLTTLLSSFETGLRDIRLTMTGIGSLAKSLSEKTQSHEEILRVVSEILRQLTQQQEGQHGHQKTS